MLKHLFEEILYIMLLPVLWSGLIIVYTETHLIQPYIWNEKIWLWVNNFIIFLFLFLYHILLNFHLESWVLVKVTFRWTGADWIFKVLTLITSYVLHIYQVLSYPHPPFPWQKLKVLNFKGSWRSRLRKKTLFLFDRDNCHTRWFMIQANQERS